MSLGERHLKTIQITPHIRFRVPEEWNEIPGGRGIRFRMPEGGTVTATAREFQRPALAGMGAGMTSEQMLSAQVAAFGQVPRMVSPSVAYASHSIPIGELGREVECRVWHRSTFQAAAERCGEAPHSRDRRTVKHRLKRNPSAEDAYVRAFARRGPLEKVERGEAKLLMPSGHT